MSSATLSTTTAKDVDFSLPISDILREGTKAVHERVENSPGAGWLARGELDRDEYVRFLMMLWHVYSTLETGLNTHSTHPTLTPTYNPALLSRTAALEADISFFLSVPTSSWQSHPLHRSLLDSFPPALLAYVTRLKDLSSSTDPSGLLAQAYVRYLGDLSGGQFIKRRISKAYALDNEKATSSLDEMPGTDFYKFGLGGGVVGAHPNGDGNTDGGRTVNMGALKKFKDWYRVGMDEGVGSDKEKKAILLDEALLAFELNYGLFEELQPPSSSTTPSPPLQTPEQLAAAATEKPQADTTFSTTTILTVILATSIAHFALVTGGFTGSKGYAKWEDFLSWIQGLAGVFQ